MANTIKIRRGLKSGLTTLQGAGQLAQAEPYLITGNTVLTNDEARLAIGLDTNTFIIMAREDKTQPLDADLTAIAALAGTTGFLKKTAADTWALDTSTYLTAEADTLTTVTGRGATTTNAITLSGGVTINAAGSTNGAIFVGQTSGTTKVVANAVAGTATLTLPTSTGTIARIEDVGAAALNLTVSGAAASGSAIGVGTGTGFTANTSGTAVGYTITVGPALSALATLMTTATAGFIRRTGVDTYTVDTSTYTTTATTLNSFAAPTGSISMGGQIVSSVGTPSAGTDAATKAYVDSVAQGLDIKPSVRAATTADITLSGPQTVDGVSVIAGERVLVKNQTTTTQNGIYVVAAGAWNRSTDTDTWVELVSAFTFVEEGTTNADTSWVSTVNAGGTLGSTAVTFVQFGAAAGITAGNGLTLTGNTLDVGAGTGITVNTDTIQISATYAGQNTITTLGTVGTGTWNATQIGAIYGGTGLTSYATGDIIYANGTNTLAKLTKPATLDSFLQMTAAGVASWVSTLDGGTF
jgi:hypothetical protein